MRSVPFKTTAEQNQAIPQAVAHLRAGGILGYPTETVYGLGCVLEEAALEVLAALKGGREEKSFLLLVSSLAQLPHLHWTPAAHKLAATFWPGPLTLALRADPDRYPARVLAETGTIAVRQTGHEGIRRLIQALGQPITSTSANLPGQPPVTDARELASLFEGLAARDSLILDAGSLKASPPSTLVDCSGPEPRLVREGAIPVDALKRCVDDLRT